MTSKGTGTNVKEFIITKAGTIWAKKKFDKNNIEL